MEHRPIPQTPLEVSTICLGTMLFGRPVAEPAAIRLVHAAIDSGINFFDTADIYEGYDRTPGSTGAVAEAILGKALGSLRSRVVITTKVGNPVGGGGYAGRGLNRTHILHQIDQSLLHLRTDYVDIYQLHRQDPDTPLLETVAVMAELIAAGKVRHWGFSNFPAPQIEEMVALCDAHGWPRPAVSQPPYSWLQRSIEEKDLPTCRRYEIGVTPYQPLQAGLLTGKYRRGQTPPAGSRRDEHPAWMAAPDEALYDKLERFEAEASAAGLGPTRYAIQWLLRRPGICSVVVGAKNEEQLQGLMSE